MKPHDRKELIRKLQEEPSSSLQEMKNALKIIGDKWSGLILLCLFSGDSRFKDIGESLPKMSPRTLSKRLKVLEEAGLITKQRFDEFPPRPVYAITPKARDLKKVFIELKHWAHKYYNLEKDQPQSSS